MREGCADRGDKILGDPFYAIETGDENHSGQQIPLPVSLIKISFTGDWDNVLEYFELWRKEIWILNCKTSLRRGEE